jgi:ribosome biogenesis protein MAK21
VQSRLLSAVLTGMNRAFPFAKLTDSTVLSKHIDALYRLTHVGGFGTSLQSLILLFQVGAGR